MSWSSGTVTYLACGHQSPDQPAPAIKNEHVVFKKETQMFMYPAVCFHCNIVNTKNQQQLIHDTYQSQIMSAENEIIERSIKIDDAKVRKELIETGKRINIGDIKLQRNAEILSVWLKFSEIWNFAERVRTICGHKPGNRTYVREYLTIVVDRSNADSMKVTGTWKTLEDQVIVQRVPFMEL